MCNDTLVLHVVSLGRATKLSNLQTVIEIPTVRQGR
jgi:hypothetical protein